jgi:hypothetical protein
MNIKSCEYLIIPLYSVYLGYAVIQQSIKSSCLYFSNISFVEVLKTAHLISKSSFFEKIMFVPQNEIQ